MVNTKDFLTELHALLSGRVQGVGFRWAVEALANHYGLSGTVANLRDGRVEVYAQGDRSTLEAFAYDLQNRPGAGQVSSMEIEYTVASRHLEGFKIVFLT